MTDPSDVPVDWHLVGVPDGQPGFIYTTDMWPRHRRPELWVSTEGACGHRVDIRGAGLVLNRLGQLLVTDRLYEPESFDFGSGRLTFTPEPPDVGLRDELQTFVADEDAPVIRVAWRCCDG